MKKWAVLTLFPNMMDSVFFRNEGVIARAFESGLLSLETFQIRDFSKNKHKNIDDLPYGGGSGMVMTPEPILESILHIKQRFGGSSKVIFATPQGQPFTQKKADSLSKEENLIFICGRYEGIDQRAIDLAVDEEISIGDYVLSGGELPTMVMLDAIARLIPGVLGNPESLQNESFQRPLLEHPHYTRPAVFQGIEVPEVLRSGNHKKIEEWRFLKSFEKTLEVRPELLDNVSFSKQEEKWLQKHQTHRNKE